MHGFLHLAGYDHENDRDARRMESLEVEILAGLGVPDPYAARPQSVESAACLTAHPADKANLPMVVPSAESEAEREGIFARLARALFGWRSGTTRADLEVVLEAAVPGETGVSPDERTML